VHHFLRAQPCRQGGLLHIINREACLRIMLHPVGDALRVDCHGGARGKQGQQRGITRSLCCLGRRILERIPERIVVAVRVVPELRRVVLVPLLHALGTAILQVSLAIVHNAIGGPDKK
jgi:hypothetical protein